MNEGLRVKVEVVIVRREVVVELLVEVVVAEVEVPTLSAFFLRGIGAGFPSESIVASWYRCLSDSWTRRCRVSKVRFKRLNLGISSKSWTLAYPSGRIGRPSFIAPCRRVKLSALDSTTSLPCPPLPPSSLRPRPPLFSRGMSGGLCLSLEVLKCRTKRFGYGRVGLAKVVIGGVFSLAMEVCEMGPSLGLKRAGEIIWVTLCSARTEIETWVIMSTGT